MILADKASLQPQAVMGLEPSHRRERRKRKKLSGTLLVGLVAFTVLALALVYVGQRTHLMTLSYEFDALDRRLSEVLREQEFLQLQITQAHSLDRVEQLATAKLGMVRPASRQFIALEPDRVDPHPSIFEDRSQERGLIATAVDWVSRHWPRMDTAEAGGDGP